MDQPLSPVMLLDITDVTGQISMRSERIYRHDAEVFARFLLDQGLTVGILHLLTCSHLIAYCKYLGENYAKATDSRMFSVARRVLTKRALSYIVKKYARLAKLIDVSPHDLRHRFGYRMAESVPLHRLAQIMGHDSLDTTKLYPQMLNL